MIAHGTPRQLEAGEQFYLGRRGVTASSDNHSRPTVPSVIALHGPGHLPGDGPIQLPVRAVALQPCKAPGHATRGGYRCNVRLGGRQAHEQSIWVEGRLPLLMIPWSPRLLPSPSLPYPTFRRLMVTHCPASRCPLSPRLVVPAAPLPLINFDRIRCFVSIRIRLPPALDGHDCECMSILKLRLSSPWLESRE